MLGIGKGFLFIRLFRSRKSEINRTVPFFFGMMNVSAAHSEWLTFRKTPMLHKRSTSVRKVCSCIFVDMHVHDKASRPLKLYVVLLVVPKS